MKILVGEDEPKTEPASSWETGCAHGRERSNATVAAHALKPIDLILDFIPVIGYLDDLLIVPLGILLAANLVPVNLMAEFRASAMSGVARDVL